jgi:hypothetical protein
VCKHLDIDVVKQSVRPCLIELSKDASDRVRELLAEHLIELAPIFGRKHTRELLLEPMLTLLRDKTPSVRLIILLSIAWCLVSTVATELYRACRLVSLKPRPNNGGFGAFYILPQGVLNIRKMISHCFLVLAPFRTPRHYCE